MRQNAPLSLEGLDPEMRETAREAARRAGMTPEEWLAAMVADRAARAAEAGRQRGRDLGSSPLKPVQAGPGRAGRDLEAIMAGPEGERRGRDSALKTGASLDSIARWIELAEDRLSEASRAASERQERTAAILGEALALMAQRLEEIERKVTDGHQPSVAAALKAVERIEQHLARTDQDRTQAQSAQIEAVLKTFEDRISQLGERLAANVPRSIGRRGLDPREEVKSAIAEIQSRQAELEDAAAGPHGAPALAGSPSRSHSEILLSLKSDIARLASQLETVRPTADLHAPAVTAIREEIERLQASVGVLATRDEVGSIERSVREFAHRIAQAPEDAVAVSQPIEDLRDEVRRLSEAVATGIPAQLARDLETIARKVDAVASSGGDPNVVDMLMVQISGMRQTLSEIAEPQRIESLADQIGDLTAQVRDLGSRQVDATEFSAMRSAVEDIREALQSSMVQSASIGLETTRQFGSLSSKLDDLIDRAPRPDLLATAEQFDLVASKLDELSRIMPRADFGAMMQEIQRLSGLMDGALSAGIGQGGLEPLLDRLDRLDDMLRQPKDRSELKAIEEMLRGLADRLDQAGRPGADLDGLERQVEALVQRLERNNGQDPALASLERAMGELMARVESLRESRAETPGRAPSGPAAVRVEPAAKLSGPPKALALPEAEAPRRKPAEPEPSYDALDMRPPEALLHSTLEQVVSRLTGLENDLDRARPEGPAQIAKPEPAAPAAPNNRLEEVLRQLQATAKAQAKAQAQAQAQPPGPPSAERPAVSATEEVLLEPGAERPRPFGREQADGIPGEGDGGDIKASFIAAARRAAQAAASEAAGRNPGEADPAARRPEGGRTSLAARLKRTFEKRRRPVLIGLAAVVLALGTVHIAGGLDGLTRRASDLTAGADAPSLPAPQEPSRARVAAREAPAADLGPLRTGPTVAGAPQPSSSQERDGLASPAQGREAHTAPGGAQAQPSPMEDPAKDSAKTAAAASERAAAAVEAPTTTNSIAPVAAAPAPERIANMASVGEIPASAGPPGLRQAALSGDPAAVYELAARAAEGRGMPRDLKLAAKLFEKAAAHGLAPAQYRIGNHYEKGLGVPRDLGAAKLWYQRAAEKGNARAMHNLAVLLAEGAGGRPDYAVAVEWFRRAAELGVRDSQFNLAVLLARGLGTPQDLAQSYTWFAIAAAQGDEDAAKKRDEVGGRLNPAALASARSGAERWHPETPIQAANEVSTPASGWTEAPRRPAQNGKG